MEFTLGDIAFAALQDTLNGRKSFIAAVVATGYVLEQNPLKGGLRETMPGTIAIDLARCTSGCEHP